MGFFERLIYNLTEVHPVHAMVVHFPIALTGAALFFILLALWRRSQMLEQVAFANLALASVSTLAAALTGMLDNARFYDGGAPNAGTKMLLATALLLVTLVTSLIRWRRPDLFTTARPAYVSAFFLSFGLALVLAFLGGVILYGF